MTWSVGGETNSETFNLIRQTQIGETPAQLQLRWRYVAIGGAGSFWYGFTFNIKYEQTWIS